jgi:hypothetical protein
VIASENRVDEIFHECQRFQRRWLRNSAKVRVVDHVLLSRERSREHCLAPTGNRKNKKSAFCVVVSQPRVDLGS